MKWQELEITNQDIINADYAINTEQMILRIYKDKGLPVQGEIYLSLSSDYEYEFTLNSDGNRLIRYRPRDFK